jgi:hypothetical protein
VNRREFITLLTGAVAWPLAARALNSPSFILTPAAARVSAN